jgi:hypothetical protein
MAFAHARGVASIGTMLNIEQHARMPDGACRLLGGCGHSIG